MLSDTYFCNFSLFQSMPDSWAIKQLFPVMPIHRLDERPDAARRAGRHHLRLRRQDRPVHRPPRREAHAAAAHASTASRTTSGAFLVGAYQEILGDLHNLFGDTNAVHVSLDDDGEVVLEAVIKGDTVREVLDYVRVRRRAPWSPSSARDVETAVREGRISYEESGRLLRFYEEGLRGYTYLERRPGLGARDSGFVWRAAGAEPADESAGSPSPEPATGYSKCIFRSSAWKRASPRTGSRNGKLLIGMMIGSRASTALSIQSKAASQSPRPIAAARRTSTAARTPIWPSVLPGRAAEAHRPASRQPPETMREKARA